MEDSNKEGFISKDLVLGLQVLQENGLALKMFRRLTKDGGDEKAQRIIAILNEPVSKYYKLIKEWEDFYLKYFNVSIDLKNINIPESPRQEKRLLVIVPAISVDRVIKAQQKYFKVRMAVSGPPAKLKNIHAHHGPYGIWVADSRETFLKLRNRSANWAIETNFEGVTLQERLLHDFKYWDESGYHLDIECMTLCAGSRFANGLVPFVNYEEKENEVLISQNGEDAAYPIFGHRQIFR
jgi:hypothetical protein